MTKYSREFRRFYVVTKVFFVKYLPVCILYCQATPYCARRKTFFSYKQNLHSFNLSDMYMQCVLGEQIEQLKYGIFFNACMLLHTHFLQHLYCQHGNCQLPVSGCTRLLEPPSIREYSFSITYVTCTSYNYTCSIELTKATQCSVKAFQIQCIHMHSLFWFKVVIESCFQP